MPAEVDLTDDSLEVRLSGGAGVLALKSQLSVPLEHVTDARVQAAGDARSERPHLRAPGAHVPGLITAGSYGSGDARQFWYAKRAGEGDELLVVDLKDESYSRIVLEVADPAADAKRISGAIGPSA